MYIHMCICIKIYYYYWSRCFASTTREPASEVQADEQGEGERERKREKREIEREERDREERGKEIEPQTAAAPPVADSWPEQRGRERSPSGHRRDRRRRRRQQRTLSTARGLSVSARRSASRR